MSQESERPEPSDPFDTLHDDDVEAEEEPRRLFERAVFERAIPEVIKRVVERAVETGFEKITEGPENLRKLAGDLKLPKEAGQYLFQHVDDTKKGVYRVVAKEIRDVLEHTNFADEIADVLTKLQFEITTQIRFVPNESSAEGSDEDANDDKPASGEVSSRKRSSVIPRPKVISKVAVKAREALERKKHEG